ncbi:MAG: four helix bundle protein [Kiritimatiellae bacterium]|jgi:hypothetical protein|nr:four helix bundle protein [Kiritimatiellia bacterium]
MGFGHEKLDVYKVALKYVAWVYNLCKRLKGMDRHARDQILRASQSIALNRASCLMQDCVYFCAKMISPLAR